MRCIQALGQYNVEFFFLSKGAVRVMKCGPMRCHNEGLRTCCVTVLISCVGQTCAIVLKVLSSTPLRTWN